MISLRRENEEAHGQQMGQFSPSILMGKINKANVGIAGFEKDQSNPEDLSLFLGQWQERDFLCVLGADNENPGLELLLCDLPLCPTGLSFGIDDKPSKIPASLGASPPLGVPSTPSGRLPWLLVGVPPSVTRPARAGPLLSTVTVFLSFVPF